MPVHVHNEPDLFRHCQPELCFNCRLPTRTWHSNDVPICRNCASVLVEADVPTKAQYLMAARRFLQHESFTFGELEHGR